MSSLPTRQRPPARMRARRSPRWRPVAVAVVAAAGLVLAACGGAPSADKDPAKSTTTTHSTAPPADSTTTTTAPPITTPTVIIGGKSVAVPTDDGTPITPLQDSGQNVVLTTKGFLPRVLYSATAAVVYTNLTPRTVTISFPHSSVSPPATIAPGGSFSYTPRADQYEYTSSTGDTGYVVVGAFTN
jgi:hypothetical protein